MNSNMISHMILLFHDRIAERTSKPFRAEFYGLINALQRQVKKCAQDSKNKNIFHVVPSISKEKSISFSIKDNQILNFRSIGFVNPFKMFCQCIFVGRGERTHGTFERLITSMSPNVVTHMISLFHN